MTRKSWTPGRVNLIGEWIDFNGGHVLPAALPLGVTVVLSARDDGVDHVCSVQFSGYQSALLDAPKSGGWADYVFGALQAARQEGWIEGGWSARLSSDIPPGAGVSSSAAVTVGVLRAAAGEAVDATRIAVLARKVENDFIGMPCGIMDQMAVAHAGPGEALGLNTRNLEFERLALPGRWQFIIIHSGVERQLAEGRYKQRRDSCLLAANKLGVEYLCDARAIDGLPDDILPLVRHVVSEECRTVSSMSALRKQDIETFGSLMSASHASLRDDFGVSTLEVDTLVADALRLGAKGARMTGAGFGGCIVALLEQDASPDWWPQLSKRHPRARFVARIAASP